MKHYMELNDSLNEWCTKYCDTWIIASCALEYFRHVNSARHYVCSAFYSFRYFYSARHFVYPFRYVYGARHYVCIALDEVNYVYSARRFVWSALD